MNKEWFQKVDKIMESKRSLLLLLIIMLVLVFMTLSLGYTNTKLEEQIYERDTYIRKLQYSDSIAKQLLEYSVNDSSKVLITRYKNGHHMTYREIAEERDSIRLEYYDLQYRNRELESKIEIYKAMLDSCKQRFPFDYKIYQEGDSVVVVESIFTKSR